MRHRGRNVILLIWQAGMFGVLLVVLAVVGSGTSEAGSLTPPAQPATAVGTMYTVEDIYRRLTTNETAAEGNHPLFPFSPSPDGTWYSLRDIYDSIPTIDGSKIREGTSYLGVAGTIPTRTLSDASETVASGYYDATTLSTVDSDLASANIKSGATIFGISGAADVSNTSSGTAEAEDILADEICWVDGNEVTGTMPDNEGDNASTAQAASSGTNYFTAPTGFYDGDDRVSATDAEVAALDSDIAAGNIVTGTAIFGINGTLLGDLFNGALGAGGFPGGSQADGGVDDNNDGGSPESDRYTGSWTACGVGNNYCGTGLSTADARDDSTQLVWSLPCNGVGCASFSDSLPDVYSWDDAGWDNDSLEASALCSGGAHGESGWFLPHQKQMMQAYIDGSYGNLEASGVYRNSWSTTTRSDGTSSAWRVNLSNGITSTNAKTGTAYVRCVRPAS